MKLRNWFRSSSKNRPITRSRTPAALTHTPPRHLAVERLEDRTVPTTFVVANTLDLGLGSLRQAILDANATANVGGADTISFHIPGPGVHTISPSSQLPDITDPVVIDGTTQPGWSPNTNGPGLGDNAVLQIELDGSLAGVGSTGLDITAGNSTVRGLVINRFDAYGIVLDGSGNNNTIEGNFIGTNPAGTAALGNHDTGVLIGWHATSTGNTVGGSSAASRNVISGNGSVNLFINGCDSNLVCGNFIGTNASGTAALSTAAGFRSGILIFGGIFNEIGSTDPVYRNLISGNSGGSGNGVEVNTFPGTGGNSVTGNYIGTDVTGTRAVPNQIGVNSGSGVASFPITVFSNLISGNTNIGLQLVGPGHNGGTATGNRIGTTWDGMAAIGNGTGVFLNAGATLGGTTDVARNIVSGNLGDGVEMANGGNIVQGNYIGTDSTGTVALANGGGPGVSVFSSQGDLVGGSMAGAGNVIAASGYRTVFITNASGTVIQGNYIDVDTTGTVNLGRATFGIDVSSGTTNIHIGAAGAGNVIGNSSVGVGIEGSGVTGVVVRGNKIFANSIGIDLGADGVTPNDTGDADTGPNKLQNFPVLTSAYAGAVTPITGTLNSHANTTYALDFYANTAAGPSGYGEGERYLGSATVTTDGGGNVSFNVALSAAAHPGEFVTATATDPDGNTSEFSAAIAVSTNRPPTADAGGPYAVAEGQSLALNASASSGPDGDALTYSWDVNGDGVFGDATGVSPTLTWAQLVALGMNDGPLTGAVKVRVSDGQATTESVAMTLTVSNTPPTATLANAGPVSEGSPVLVSLSGASDPSPADVAAGLHFTFALSAGQLATSYAAAGTTASAPFTFADNGAYTVYGRVFDKDGGSSDYQTTVTVNNVAPTVGAITAPLASLLINTSISTGASFTDPGTADTHTAVWAWGDGTTSQGTVTEANGSGSVTGSHAYTTPGVYAVTLTVTDGQINGSGQSVYHSVVVIAPSSLSGLVFEDFNNDGQVDFGEKGIHGVAVTLTGTDDLGNSVNLGQTTDADGAYVFLGLRPGNYSITEMQPAGYLQGIDTVGTAGGSLAGTDQFLIPLGVPVTGLNYNFGEQPASTGSVKKGQAAGIGFWNNKNGQALIKALNGGVGTELADWLAATMPNTFGVQAGANNLAGKSNAYVATRFQQDFVLKGVKVDAQVLATALNVYATNATLDSTKVAAQYGFTVSGDGLGSAAVNVGSDGDAFGVANGTTMSVIDLLRATDLLSASGVLYGGSSTKRSHANDVYGAINQAGGI